MANRIELGGYYPSRGEQSFGELRARFFIEVPNALQQKAFEVFTNNPDKFDSVREVYAAFLTGELSEELEAENEVDPEDYKRDEWIEAQEDVPEGVVAADD